VEKSTATDELLAQTKNPKHWFFLLGEHSEQKPIIQKDSLVWNFIYMTQKTKYETTSKYFPP
jgi:hypothetical protein